MKIVERLDDNTLVDNLSKQMDKVIISLGIITVVAVLGLYLIVN